MCRRIDRLVRCLELQSGSPLEGSDPLLFVPFGLQYDSPFEAAAFATGMARYLKADPAILIIRTEPQSLAKVREFGLAVTPFLIENVGPDERVVVIADEGANLASVVDTFERRLVSKSHVARSRPVEVISHRD